MVIKPSWSSKKILRFLKAGKLVGKTSCGLRSQLSKHIPLNESCTVSAVTKHARYNSTFLFIYVKSITSRAMRGLNQLHTYRLHDQCGVSNKQRYTYENQRHEKFWERQELGSEATASTELKKKKRLRIQSRLVLQRCLLSNASPKNQKHSHRTSFLNTKAHRNHSLPSSRPRPKRGHPAIL